MGTNKRYADAVDQQMTQRIIERIMREDSPIGLTDQELELDRDPLTKTPRPVPVLAWIRYGKEPIKIEGHAVARTPRAVAVEWKTAEGATHRAWVWASAVSGR